MKKWICFAAAFYALTLGAEVSVISVTDEDKHTKKEDFYHTFEYFISSGNQQNKCQATRIAPHWFATAAHCVKDTCQNQCTLRMDLLDTPVSAMAEWEHSAKKPTVFVHPGYSNKQLVKNDFALIKLDVNRAPKIYYRRSKTAGTPHTAMSQPQFTAWLARNPRTHSKYRHVLSPQLPPIAVFDNANYLMDRNISVISIFSGKRTVKPDPHPVYYVRDLGYAYTTNFGIRKGMSGSGVMTNTGELIGIISAYVDADLYKGREKIKHENWFMFPVFNESLVSFMREVMGSDFNSVSQKDAYPYLARKTRKDFTPILTLMKSKK